MEMKKKQVKDIESPSRGGFGSTTRLEKMLDKKEKMSATIAEEYSNGTRKTLAEQMLDIEDTQREGFGSSDSETPVYMFGEDYNKKQ